MQCFTCLKFAFGAVLCLKKAKLHSKNWDCPWTSRTWDTPGTMGSLRIENIFVKYVGILGFWDCPEDPELSQDRGDSAKIPKSPWQSRNAGVFEN